jgi:hypothetical protein
MSKIIFRQKTYMRVKALKVAKNCKKKKKKKKKKERKKENSFINLVIRNIVMLLGSYDPYER